jgi:hypothetical protein
VANRPTEIAVHVSGSSSSGSDSVLARLAAMKNTPEPARLLEASPPAPMPPVPSATLASPVRPAIMEGSQMDDSGAASDTEEGAI